jgi:hypothetical protein
VASSSRWRSSAASSRWIRVMLAVVNRVRPLRSQSPRRVRTLAQVRRRNRLHDPAATSARTLAACITSSTGSRCTTCAGCAAYITGEVVDSGDARQRRVRPPGADSWVRGCSHHDRNHRQARRAQTAQVALAAFADVGAARRRSTVIGAGIIPRGSR